MALFNRQGVFGSIPPVTKNILIINVVLFLVCEILKSTGRYFIPNFLTLYTFSSPNFNPIQLVSHIFMHGSFGHIFFNMFGVFMFGRVLESVLGSKKYFILYFAAGLGAALLQLAVYHFQFNDLLAHINQFKLSPSPDEFWRIFKPHAGSFKEASDFAQYYMDHPKDTEVINAATEWLDGLYGNLITNTGMLGASGAVFGILAGFAMMFPNVELMLMFLPVPIKAKYFVPIYAVMELFFGMANFSGDNIAHFAHLGGAVVGFFLIYSWKKKPLNRF